MTDSSLRRTKISVEFYNSADAVFIGGRRPGCSMSQESQQRPAAVHDRWDDEIGHSADELCLVRELSSEKIQSRAGGREEVFVTQHAKDWIATDYIILRGDGSRDW